MHLPDNQIASVTALPGFRPITTPNPSFSLLVLQYSMQSIAFYYAILARQ